MSDTQADPLRTHGSLSAVSTALVALHKEQFGRGPTRARSNFAGPDTLVCILHDALLPAERAMVEMGESQRVLESRTWFQVATAQRFIDTVEPAGITRTARVRSDPTRGSGVAPMRTSERR